ncbi:hypothetical protein [Nitrococcus mobilis]|uniref:Uncharacterized protein n=1 Tax=Nitrococcus mobilis Nb-231 TaxID=314278 RepID=A4BNW1_9GAMM|nr:hypothetical protein [Nitrococcus mobilis]EAR22910.1 hypothetical protein NB231_10668 [Nitrococcus mobilis Nb-231]
MGKASRGKRRNITRDDDQALRLAAEIILDPRLIETFQSIKLHEKLESFRSEDFVTEAVPLLEHSHKAPQAQDEKTAEFTSGPHHQTPASWAAGLHKGLRNRPFRDRLNATIEAGRQALRRESDFEHHTDRFDLDDSTRAQAEHAYSATRERLLAEPAAPGWLTLAMACIARTIATNAHERFAGESWDELTSFMYELERDFLGAAGEALANKLVEFDHIFYEDRLPEIVGSRMPFGLAELACNMADSSLFKPSSQP